MIAIITDAHFGARQFNKSIFRLMIEFYENQFFPYLLKNKIKHVIHLGDFVDNRNLVDLWLMDEMKRRFFKWFEENGITFHTLVGNHDTYYKSTLDPNFFGENTKEFAYVKVYNKQTTATIDGIKMAMVPWIIDYNQFEPPKDVDVVCGHFDIKTFPMVKGIDSREGFDRKIFRDYKLVLSGHYHINSKKQNIHYVGSPYWVSWSDYNIPKGFYVLDRKLKPKFVKNVTSPKFIKIFYHEVGGEQSFQVIGLNPPKKEDISLQEVTELAGKNYCKIIIEKSKNHKMFEDFYNIMMLNSKDGFKIEVIDTEELIERIDYEQMENVILGEGDVITAIKQYISAIKFEKGINQKLLLEISTHLYQKAQEKLVDIQTDI